MRDLEDRALTRHGFHGEWNYTLLAAPDPQPEPPAPDPQPDLGAWNHPVLTGLDPAAVHALAAALALPAASVLRLLLVCHWLQDLCSNWSPAGPNPIDDETRGPRAARTGHRYRNDSEPTAGKSQRVQPGRRRWRCQPVNGPPGSFH